MKKYTATAVGFSHPFCNEVALFNGSYKQGTKNITKSFSQESDMFYASIMPNNFFTFTTHFDN